MKLFQLRVISSESRKQRIDPIHTFTGLSDPESAITEKTKRNIFFKNKCKTINNVFVHHIIIVSGG